MVILSSCEVHGYKYTECYAYCYIVDNSFNVKYSALFLVAHLTTTRN